jgi:hypothetical protein
MEQNVEVSYIQITLTYFEDKSNPIYALGIVYIITFNFITYY